MTVSKVIPGSRSFAEATTSLTDLLVFFGMFPGTKFMTRPEELFLFSEDSVPRLVCDFW